MVLLIKLQVKTLCVTDKMEESERKDKNWGGAISTSRSQPDPVELVLFASQAHADADLQQERIDRLAREVRGLSASGASDANSSTGGFCGAAPAAPPLPATTDDGLM